jgi:hypothetical protein
LIAAGCGSPVTGSGSGVGPSGTPRDAGASADRFVSTLGVDSAPVFPSADAAGPTDNPVDGAVAGPDAGDGGSVVAGACSGYVIPTPCDTRDGLSVYCLPPGGSIVMRGEVDYPARASIVALGVGSVTQDGFSLGYFSMNDPFTCQPTGCTNATGYGNSGVGGAICEVTFDLTLPADAVGTALYTITAKPDAPNGDYRVGFQANYVWHIVTPGFYLRVGPITPR